MSRIMSLFLKLNTRFPRVSGDEPAWEYWDSNSLLFSPRERG